MDLERRFELLLKAEAFLIDQAWVIPIHCGGGGYVATKLEPFTSPYAPFGIADLQYKGQVVMKEPIDTEEYMRRYEEWEQARKAALEEQAAKEGQ